MWTHFFCIKKYLSVGEKYMSLSQTETLALQAVGAAKCLGTTGILNYRVDILSVTWIFEQSLRN